MSYIVQNMKRMCRWAVCLLLVMACGCLAGCEPEPISEQEKEEPRLPESSDENENNGDEDGTEVNKKDVIVVWCSIAQDSCVNARDVNEIVIRYSDSVMLNNEMLITLNESVVLDASVRDNYLHLPVTLVPNTEYALLVDDGAIYAGENARVKHFVLRFSTRASLDKNRVTRSLSNVMADDCAMELYDRMLAEYGEHTFSGLKECDALSYDCVKSVEDATGRCPAIVMWPLDKIVARGGEGVDVNALVEHHKAGGIVACGWQWLVPTNKDDAVENYSEDNDFSIAKALISTNWEFAVLERSLDYIASVLRKLQNEGVPVLFAPLQSAQKHWWAGKTARHYIYLWKLMYDRLMVKHELNNLIWVWTTDAMTSEQMGEWYPGDKYVDIVGVKLEVDGEESQSELFFTLNELIGGKKMLALTDCKMVPNPDKCYLKGDTWLYFVSPRTNNYMQHPRVVAL